MRLSEYDMKNYADLSEGVITLREIYTILHIIRKPNPIIVLLFIKNISRAPKTQKYIKWVLTLTKNLCKTVANSIRCHWILDVSLLNVSFKNQVTSLGSLILCFCYLYHLIIWKCPCHNVQTLQPFARILAVQHKICCWVTNFFYYWMIDVNRPIRETSSKFSRC